MGCGGNCGRAHLVTLAPPPQAGHVGYGRHSDLLASYCRDHGLHPWVGDPAHGFISCQVVHPGTSCSGNALSRLLRGLGTAAVMYVPLYFLPLLLDPAQLRARPLRILAAAGLRVCRSSLFLGLFISTIWFSVCRVRRALRNDTTLGPLLGSALCGWWVFLEGRSRQLELALYVLPRALESYWRQLAAAGAVRGVPYGDVLMFCIASAITMYCFEQEPENMRPTVLRALNTYFGWV